VITDETLIRIGEAVQLGHRGERGAARSCSGTSGHWPLPTG
jgi:hypothetical protein